MSQSEFIPSYPLAELRPADYNPRKLDDDKFQLLQESLRKFGVIKPVIINGGNGILTAGHQRTRAMKAIGLTHCPAIRLQGITRTDEIRFNLYHNSIETGKSEVTLDLSGSELEPGTYAYLDHTAISYPRNANAIVVNGMSGLILRYGAWGSAVCSEDGRVLLNSDYAVACHQLRTPLLVYMIPREDEEEMMKYLSIEYGVYCYDVLGVKSYNQLHCQMHRLQGKKARKITSTLYETEVIPTLRKEERTVDFGAGRCAYADMLAGQGYAILPYEPHYQTKGALNVREVVSQINRLHVDISHNGLYDVVVLDSVLNSVVNSYFEHAVLTACNALLGNKGRIHIGTRSYAFTERLKTFKKNNTKSRDLQFLDKDNFGATYRSGVWTMQHFHTHESLRKLLLQYFEQVEIHGGEGEPQIYAVASIPRKLPRAKVEEAVNVEFNMEYPGDYRHNRHEPLVKALLKALEEARGFAPEES